MPTFNFIGWRERKAQNFDKDNITLTKAGKTFNVYDKIQEAREDTEIYTTLEKYGCIDRLMLDAQGVYDDFTKFKDLRGIKEQQKAAEQMFYNLPLETRQHFNNDMNVFVKDGEKYMKKIINAEKDKIEAQKAEITKITSQPAQTTTEAK